MATKSQLFLLLCLLLTIPLFADTVVLRNGTKLEGKIVGQSRTELRIQTDSGVQTIKKDDIQRVTYGQTEADKNAAEERKKKAEEERRKKAEELKKTQEEKKQKAEEERLKKLEEAKKKKEAEEKKRIDQQTKKTQPTTSISKRNAFLYSLLLPGAGQYYQGRTYPALAYGAGGLSLLLIAAKAKDDHTETRNAYVSTSRLFVYLNPATSRAFGQVLNDEQVAQRFAYASFVTSEARKKQEKTARNENNLRTALLVLWTANLYDVVKNHPTNGPVAGFTPDGMMLGYRYHF